MPVIFFWFTSLVKPYMYMKKNTSDIQHQYYKFLIWLFFCLNLMCIFNHF